MVIDRHPSTASGARSPSASGEAAGGDDTMVFILTLFLLRAV